MKKFTLAFILVFVSIHLSGCVTNGVSSSSATPTVANSVFGSSESNIPEVYQDGRLDVAVAVFDPGLPENEDDYEKLGIWPEVRRTEAIRFAGLLKHELQETAAFGVVRVTPDLEVAADLFIVGEIKKSNGEDVNVEIKVYDASGKRWMKKSYSHRVKSNHADDSRRIEKDLYQPVFQNIANSIANQLKQKKSVRIAELRAIADLQFANVFVGGTLSQHLKLNNRIVELVSVPAQDDPMFIRMRALRIADGLFMDKMQSHYDNFVQETEVSYLSWQEFSLDSSKQKRKAKEKATLQMIGGIALLLGAAKAADDHKDDDSNAKLIAATAAAAGGVRLLRKSFTSRAKGKLHHQNLLEHGKDLNFEVARQLIKVEDETVALQGSIQQQYKQWQHVLKNLSDSETIPDVQQ